MENNQFYAVAGFPVSHSKSPLIFNSLFKEKKINAHYSRISARSENEVLDIFNRLGLSGMNITAPLKNEILHSAEDRDEPSESIGGINTLLNLNGKIKGYNTDHYGVSRTLTDNSIDVEGKKCLVIGAGSAGRAAVYALTGMGGNVRIINRTFKKAHVLAGDMKCSSVVYEKLQSEISECDILISTISSGIGSIKSSWLRKETIVFDAVYRISTLRKTAEAAGCTVIRGESWLLNQALPAFRIFTGRDVSVKEKDKLFGLLMDHNKQISRVILMADKTPAESIKKELSGIFKDLEINIVTDPGKTGINRQNIRGKEEQLKILICSGSEKQDMVFFQSADLVFPATGGIEDTITRIRTELGNVL